MGGCGARVPPPSIDPRGPAGRRRARAGAAADLGVDPLDLGPVEWRAGRDAAAAQGVAALGFVRGGEGSEGEAAGAGEQRREARAARDAG